MFVCPKCFGNKGLNQRLLEIRPKFPYEKCSFHPKNKGLPIGAVAAIVDPVFRNNFGIGEYNPAIDDIRGDSLADLIAELTLADDESVSEAIAGQLIEDEYSWPQDGGYDFYSRDYNYVPDASALMMHSILWDNFCRKIVHGQRFFNDEALNLLERIFEGIHLQYDADRRSAVYIIEPGDSSSIIYRARAADDFKQANQIIANAPKELGAPPQRMRRPGRMSPSGIGAFYGAFDLETCVAELRPIVGSLVVGGQFEIAAPICVLDVTRFNARFKEPSLFSKNHIKKTGQWRFMQRFMWEISQPISPNDEHLDYIPTQAVAEFLLHKARFEIHGQQHRIEGIIFRSAQHNGGRNIVLLGDAGIVEIAKPTQDEPSSKYEGILFDESDIFQEIGLDGPARLRFKFGSAEIRKVTGATFDAPPLEGEI